MIETLFDELDLDDFWARQYHTVFMLRRLAFTMVAIYFSEYG